MATMTATRRETVQPRPDQPQPAVPAGWPLAALLDLGAVPTAPTCARAWTRAILWEWRLTRLAESAELIASELTTNALLASRELDRPAIQLILLSDRERLAILVRDLSPGAPAPQHASTDDESGRGLMLVEAISDRFGWYRPQDGAPGKIVWAVLHLSAGQSCHDHRVYPHPEGVPAAMTSPAPHNATAQQQAGMAERDRACELAPGVVSVSAAALPSRPLPTRITAARRVPTTPEVLRRVRAALDRL